MDSATSDKKKNNKVIKKI